MYARPVRSSLMGDMVRINANSGITPKGENHTYVYILGGYPAIIEKINMDRYSTRGQVRPCIYTPAQFRTPVPPIPDMEVVARKINWTVRVGRKKLSQVNRHGFLRRSLRLPSEYHSRFPRVFARHRHRERCTSSPSRWAECSQEVWDYSHSDFSRCVDLAVCIGLSRGQTGSVPEPSSPPSDSGRAWCHLMSPVYYVLFSLLISVLGKPYAEENAGCRFRLSVCISRGRHENSRAIECAERALELSPNLESAQKLTVSLS